MKKLSFLFIPLFLILSCNNQEKAVTTAKIGGQISRFDTDLILIKNDKGDITDSVFVDDQGFYLLSKEIEKPGYHTFSYNDNNISLFLDKGFDLTLNFDAGDLAAPIKFDGKGSLENNYLQEMKSLRDELQLSTKELFSLDETAFVAKLDSIRDAKNNLFETTFTEDVEVNAYFLTTEKAKIQYARANTMLLYPRYHKYFSGNDSFEVSENFDAYLDELNLNDPALLSSGDYSRFLETYLQQQASNLFDSDSNYSKNDNGWFLAQIDAIESSLENADIKQHLAFRIMSDQIRYQGIKDLDELMAKYEPYSNDSLMGILQERIAEWESIANGKPAPGFTYPDIDSNMHSLSDFAGKYVYIDVWATWCGPCRGEIPYLKKLEEEFKDKNVQFISVSIDDSKDDWVKFEQSQELGGLQLFAGGWDSDIAVNNLIHSIPRFILIDTEGNILDNNAPRPSGDIAKLLNSLDHIEM